VTLATSETQCDEPQFKNFVEHVSSWYSSGQCILVKIPIVDDFSGGTGHPDVSAAEDFSWTMP
jgi:hypothetical protein